MIQIIYIINNKEKIYYIRKQDKGNTYYLHLDDFHNHIFAYSINELLECYIKNIKVAKFVLENNKSNIEKDIVYKSFDSNDLRIILKEYAEYMI